MYLLVRLLFAIFSRLSLKTLQSIGRTTGSLMYHLMPDRRRTAIKNCEIIGITDSPEKTAKDSFRNTFCSYLESFYIKNVDETFVDQMVDVEYIGEKPEAKGCFIISAHIGSWELAPSIMAEIFEHKGSVIGRKIKNKKIDDFITRQRTGLKIGYIPHRNATESINEHIEKGLAVGALLDHSSSGKDSMGVPFFGINTTFIKGIPLLSMRKNFPILPAFVIRDGSRFKMIVYPLLYPNRELRPRDRAHDIARRLNEVYEDIIRKYPEQWYLIHKRFKKIEKDGKFISSQIY